MSNPYVDPVNDGGYPVAGEIIEPQQTVDIIVDVEAQQAAEAAETTRAEGAEAGVAGTASTISHSLTIEVARALAAEGLLLPISALPTATVTALIAGTNITLAGGDGSGHGTITVSSHQTVLNGVTVTGTPTAGQTLVATSPTAASWQTVSYSSTSPVFTAVTPSGAGVIGMAYSYQFAATNTPTSWAVASGTIPAGLTFSTSTGLLSGTPTTGATYSFSISAINGSGTATSGGLTITVTAPAPVFTAVAPTAATVGTAYSYIFAASNTTTFAVATGALPTGLALTSGGVLSGTPSAAATFTFTVSATGPGGTTTSGSLSIVASSTLPAAPVFSAYSPPAAIVGNVYSYQFAASNTPTSWAVSTGSIPTGLTFSTSTGLLSGTPNMAGSFSFVLSATNAGGTGTTGTLIVTATAIPAFTADSPPGATVGITYSYQFAASGTPTSWAVASGTIPAGLTFSTSTGRLSGTPTTAATYTFVINAINSAGTTGSGSLSIITSVPAPAFTASSPPAAITTVAYSYQFAATNTTSFSHGSGSVPAGLTLSAGGLLSGTPTTATSYTFGVIATGPTSPPATATVTVVVSNLSYETVVLNDSPVGYWRLNETSGTTAADSSGHTNTGTYVGTHVLGATSPITNDSTSRALDLTGTSTTTNGYVTVPDSTSLNLTGSAFTIEVWVKSKAPASTATSPYAGLLFKQVGNNNYGIGHDSVGAYPQGNVTTTGVTSGAVTSSVSNDWTNTWMMIDVVYNGSTFIMYQNGSAIGAPVSVTGTVLSTSGAALIIGNIGSGPSPFSYQWTGYICEVSLYNTALSPTRVLAHYNAA